MLKNSKKKKNALIPRHRDVCIQSLPQPIYLQEIHITGRFMGTESKLGLSYDWRNKKSEHVERTNGKGYWKSL